MNLRKDLGNYMQVTEVPMSQIYVTPTLVDAVRKRGPYEIKQTDYVILGELRPQYYTLIDGLSLYTAFLDSGYLNIPATVVTVLDQFDKDHAAMEAIRGGIVGPSIETHKGIMLGYRCGSGPIRDDPADAILDAKAGHNDGIDGAVDNAIKKLGCNTYNEWLTKMGVNED